jgi:hypothetical protein
MFLFYIPLFKGTSRGQYACVNVALYKWSQSNVWYLVFPLELPKLEVERPDYYCIISSPSKDCPKHHESNLLNYSAKL